MKEHFCLAEQSLITYEKECNWCGEKEWVGLTDWEINYVANNNNPLNGIRTFARAIEAKLKEKNTRQDGDCKHCVNGCPACDARRQSNVLP